MCGVQRQLVAKVESGDIEDGDFLDVVETRLQCLVDTPSLRAGAGLAGGEIGGVGPHAWGEEDQQPQGSGTRLEEYDDILVEKLPDMQFSEKFGRPKATIRSKDNWSGLASDRKSPPMPSIEPIDELVRRCMPTVESIFDRCVNRGTSPCWMCSARSTSFCCDQSIEKD